MTGLIQEFYGRELAYLRQTLTLSEETKNQEAARIAAHKFKEYTSKHEIPGELARIISKAEVKSRLAGEPVEQWELIELAAEKWPEVTGKFGAWVREQGLWNAVGSENYPTWDLYDGCQILRDQWLVSFSDEPWITAKKGFTSGFEEDTIGYGNTHNGPGYNIGYALEDVSRGKRLSAEDAKKAVIFRAPGIRTEHTGANCYQVLFWGPDAKDIVPTHLENGEWMIQDWATDRTLFKSEDLVDAARWVAGNFTQYAKALRPK